MTSIQHPSVEQGSIHPDLAGIHLLDVDEPSTHLHGPSFGSRLYAAREARGLNLEVCANTLKLPTRVLRQLECDESDGTDSKIYLGSYVAKYGRYLGVDEATVQLEMDRIRQSEPPLVATGGISRSRFLFDRYATAATYLVLTAVIVVPMIWLGVRGSLDRDLTHMAPPDAAPVAQSNNPPVPRVAGAAAARPTALPQAEEQPLMASMAAFPSLDNSGSLSDSHPAAAPAGANDRSHNLSLSLTAPSWVEVIDSDGTRLEYGLLPAGSNKTYHSDQPIEVRIGNVSGTRVTIDGQPVGLDDFQRANVAHFRMQVEDGKASAANL